MANNVQNQYNLVEAAKDKTYEYKEEAKTTASLLENATANATTLSFEEQATASYSNGVFNFGIPTGPQGKKGDKGDTGYGVPIVTTADNGKFLRVVDGTWVADTIPSASGVNF